MPTSPRSPEHLNRDGTLKQMIGGNGDLRQSINLRSFKGGMKSIALSFRKNPSISSKKGVGTRCCNGNGAAATTAAKAASPLPPTDTSPLTVIVERNSGGDSRESSRRQSTEQAPTSLGPAPADSGISLVLSESGQSLLPDEESILELSGRTTLTAATESCDSIGGLSEASGLGRAAERSEASACSRSSAVTREPSARDGSKGKAKAHAHLCLDQPALAQWGTGADELWFPCRILSLRHDGTVDVKYDDGNIERSKLASRVVNCTPAEAAQHALDCCDASSSVSVSVPGEASSSTSVLVKQQV